MSEREILRLDPIADSPEVGRWLSAMEDARRDTLHELEDVPDAALDWAPDDRTNTIGTLLYHVALVEDDWLFVDIFGETEHRETRKDLLPFDDRVEGERLTPVTGMTLERHLDRLAAVRSALLDRIRPMTVEEFHRPRPSEGYDVTPAWVLHHLLQHEAEHRAHIAWVREEWRRAAGP